MPLLFAIVLGVGVGLVLGGRPQHLVRLRFRWPALIFLALGLQLAIFTDAARIPLALIPGLYLMSSLLAMAWVIRNLSIAGFPCLAVGALSNVLAIAANGGRMPVDRGLLARAQGDRYVQAVALGRARTHSVLAGPHTNLLWLTDRFLLPLPGPFATVVSPGDLLIGLGVIWFVAAAMRAPGSAGAPNSAYKTAA